MFLVAPRDLQVRGHVELLYVHVNHVVYVGWHLQIRVCFVHVVFAMLNLFPCNIVLLLLMTFR